MGASMGGDTRIVKQPNWFFQLLGQIGLYRRSAGFFLIIGLALLGGGIFLQSSALRAENPVLPADPRLQSDSLLLYTLTKDGSLIFGKTKQSPEVFSTETTYRYRLQVVNRPTEFTSEIAAAVWLPESGTEETIGHRFINNGGALSTSSELIESRVIYFTALDVGTESQLAIEFEIPKNFIQRSALFALQERASELPSALWTSVSIALPALTILLLLVLVVARSRRVSPLKEEVTAPPSRLAPALVGILLRGRLTSRELAATLLDLARRGHLAIHHYSVDDYRFRRLESQEKLEDFEKVLLEQIFGPSANRASSDEVSFSLAQEVFSKRVSQSFILAYRKINALGFFYTNPLRLHRRYQYAGIFLFLLGVVGFFSNLFVFTAIPSLLFFWIGMILSAMFVTHFAKSLPSRTVFGDRELAKWLAFGRYLSSKAPANFASHSQEKYLSYLPYAIIFGVEVEWTQSFYELPFIQPNWYVAANIATIDQFANKVFPLFGYLSHILASSSQPAAR